MINSPQPIYPSAKAAGVRDTSVISYGTINIDTRVKAYSKKTKANTVINSVIITSNTLFMPSSTIGPEGYFFKTKVAIIVPTTTEDGDTISKANAVKVYLATGRHLGAFTSIKAAEKYVKKLNINIRLHGDSETFRNTNAASFLPVNLMKQIGESYHRLIDAPFAGIVQLADLDNDLAQLTFMNNIISIDVSLDMDLSSQITIELIDPSYKMTEMNYFVPRRDVFYRGTRYEIADVSVGPGDGGSPRVSIVIVNKSIQRMKRAKRSGYVSASSAYEYAGRAATKFNLGFIGQQTAKTKNTFSTKTDNSEESVWDVLTRTAQENQFVVFEVDGVLVYAQHEFLMYKFGLIETNRFNKKTKKREVQHFVPLLHIPGLGPEMDLQHLIKEGYVGESAELALAGKAFQLATYPSFETSDNDPLAASGSCEVLMPNGGQLRPGYTAVIGPEPSYFFGGYLITAVSFQEGSPDSAKVTFRTPEELTGENKKPLISLYGTSPTRMPFNHSTTNLGPRR